MGKQTSAGKSLWEAGESTHRDRPQFKTGAMFNTAELLQSQQKTQSLKMENGDWWTVGSSGGPAGTSGTALSWWNHGNNTHDWQAQLSAPHKIGGVQIVAKHWPLGV